MVKTYFPSELGAVEITGDKEGIQSITVMDFSPSYPVSDQPLLEKCVQQLKEYLAGQRKEFKLRLNPAGTQFQKKVWTALEEIPYGKTISYMDLAKKLGDPKAIRAVAAANGKNPLWIVIPCHRVVGSDGSMTGYAGGIHRKKWLINHESQSKQVAMF